MSTPNARLSPEQIRRVRAQHPISDVLRRARIELPAGAGADVMISCPTPGHEDGTPSCMVHAASGRFYCFGCGTHGDVFTLVRELTGTTSLAQIADLLDSGRAIGRRNAPIPRRAAPVPAPRPDQPLLDRTPLARILDVNNAAWRYLTSERLADQARAYLARRGIDVWQLESQVGTPLAGCTPADHRGLTAHLRRQGFEVDEILDAGWASRRDDGLTDRFHRRVLFPVLHPAGGVAGVIGRDVTDHARHKYLNTARTAAYRKGELLYQPCAGSPCAVAAVVCEGPLDALAIAAADITSGRAIRLFPVAPSGTALTPHQAHQIAALSSRGTIVCADGDPAGVAAGAGWQRLLQSTGARPTFITLPDSHDPASYQAAHGSRALSALIDQAITGGQPGFVRDAGIPA